jgi:enterochelin esterase-like enzyme
MKTCMSNNKRTYFFVVLFFPLALMVTAICGGCEKHVPVEEKEPFVRLLTGQEYYSHLINRTMHYAVLLPADYDSTNISYPVVYLLHGYGDDETAWYTGGNIRYYVDRYSADIEPMIYVMPEAFNSYYVNRYNGSMPFMDVFITELIPTIDSLFRTQADSQHRAVMGYSMGGYGALILPALNPEVISTGVPLSMSFRTDEQYMAESQDAFNNQWGSIFGGSGATGTNRLTGYYLSHSPFHFFNTSTAINFQNTKFFFDCGDDEESLSRTNDSLHCLLRELGIQHQYRVRNGAHTWSYWSGALHEALVFISETMEGRSYPEEPVPANEGTHINSDDYSSVSIGTTGLKMNILTPEGYASSPDLYPVLYMIHDTGSLGRNDCILRLFSILRNAMTTGDIPQAILAELPVSTSGTGIIASAVSQVDAAYRTFPESGRRVLAANGNGGATISELEPSVATLFDSFFLFDATPGETPQPIYPTLFYYLDITDNGKAYAEYYDLNLRLREEGVSSEYRVRHGSDSYQSFLNGVNSSFFYLKKQLKN